jgi:putative heme transporter
MTGPTNRRWQPVAKTVAMAAVALGVAAAVYSQRSTIGRGLHGLGNLNWGWVAAASLTEVTSMVALALLYRELLQANRARLALTWILAASYTANAISVTVPVIGSGMASRRAYRQFRAGGADPGAATLTLTMAGVVSTVTLATVVTAGALLSGNPGAAVGGLVAAMALLGAGTALAVALRSDTGQNRLVRLIAFSTRCSQRVIRRPQGDPRTVAHSVLASVRRMRLSGPTLTRVAWWGLVNWWADIACLACAMRAAGLTGLSIGKVLVVWTAAAGAASLSPTPAGIGAVEIAMVAALSAVGAKGPSAITAVLVYRVIALKGAVSLWAVLYSWLRRPRGAAGPVESTPPAIPGSAPPEGSR